MSRTRKNLSLGRILSDVWNLDEEENDDKSSVCRELLGARSSEGRLLDRRGELTNEVENHLGHLGQAGRLLQERVNAHLGRPLLRLGGFHGREDDDGRLRRMPLEKLGKLEPLGRLISSGEVKVENGEGVFVEGDEGSGFFVGTGAVDEEPALCEVVPQRESDSGLVVDYEDTVRHGRGRSQRAGLPRNCCKLLNYLARSSGRLLDWSGNQTETV